MSMFPTSSDILHAMLANGAKASLLACGVALICLLLRRWISPAWRHALWCTVFLRLLVPDVAVPGWRWNLGDAILRATTAPAEQVLGAPGVAMEAGTPRSMTTEASATADADGVPGDVGAHAEFGGEEPALPMRGMFEFGRVLALAWLLGTLAWWAAVGTGWWRFRRRVVARSTQAGAEARALLAACATEADVRSRVRLRCSAHVGRPAVYGITRHCILLPESIETSLSSDELRLLLLHELGHVKRHDSIVQLIASVLLGLHWWNPFLWLAWRELRREAEAATDAWVLRRTGENSAPAYGGMLLNLAARAGWASVALMLVPSLINATGGVRRLKRRLLDVASNRHAGRRGALLGASVFVVLAMVGFAQEAAKKSGETEPATVGLAGEDTIGGVVVDEEGQPIAGAEVEIDVLPARGRFAKSVVPEGYKEPAPVKTEAQGRWQLHGVPMGVAPAGSGNTLDGKDTYQFFVSHPEFLVRQFKSAGEVPLEDDASFRQGTAKLVLKRGLVMRGTVRDEKGKPIPNATVQRNPTTEKHGDPVALTDAEGRYELKSALPGNLAVRISAKGHATLMQRIEMRADTTDDFVMSKGQTLRLAIRDDRGQPVQPFKDQRVPTPLVTIYPPGEGWKSAENLWSSEGVDADGDIVWNEAPAGELVAEIAGRDFARVPRNITAGGEVVIKLVASDRLPTVTLSITDADTGAPLTGCTIATGTVVSNHRDTPSSWMSGTSGVVFKRGDAEGEYVGKIRDSRSKYRFGFCVRREGYEPAITPPVDPAQGSASLKIALRKGSPVELTVQDDQGKAAPGAKVYVIWQSDYLTLRNYVVRTGSGGTDDLEYAGETGADGRCILPPCAADAVVLAIHESGFAVSTWADLARRPTLALGLYAQAEARVKQDGKPVAGVKCEYYGNMELSIGRRASLVVEAVSDAEGRVSFPRVLPTSAGLVRESRVQPPQPGHGTVFSPATSFKKVPAGMTTYFDLEAKLSRLRSVTGRLVVEGGGVPVASRTQSLRVHLVRASPSGLVLPIGSASVDDEGRFTFDGAEPGGYTLQLTFSVTRDPPSRYTFEGGKSAFEFTVPEPNAESAGKTVDLGDIKLLDTRK